MRTPWNSRTYVTNNDRIELLILITEFGISCYQAARVLDMNYGSAKVISRTFKKEQRVTSNARLNSKEKIYCVSEAHMLKTSHTIRKDALLKLALALEKGAIRSPKKL